MQIRVDHTQVYVGEPGNRATWLAILLSLGTPGLGHVYAGQPKRGLILLAVWYGIFFLTMGAFVLMEVFLLRALLALAAAWFVLQIWSFFDLRKECNSPGRTYILKHYNSTLVYLGIAVFLFLLPHWALYRFYGARQYGVHVVESPVGFPALQEGDWVLYRKYTMPQKAIMRGDLVVSEVPNRGSHLLRVLGVSHDKVRVNVSGRVSLNDILLPRQPLGRIEWRDHKKEAVPGEDLVGYVEMLGKFSYETFMDLNASLYGDAEEELNPDEYFLLADNRTAALALDSRHIGPVKGEVIRGRALYVLFQSHPDEGTVQWDRSGLRIH